MAKRKPNVKLRRILKEKGLSVYGLGKFLETTPQASQYIVTKKNLSIDYDRLKKIAEYVGENIEDIVD